MEEDIKQQIVAEMQSAPLKMFAIQLDESTDVAGCPQLLLFVQHIKGIDFKEEFLFCQALETTTKGEIFFQEVSKFFEKEGLFWYNVCGITTVGTPTMLGSHSGYQAKVKGTNPDTIHLHCLIHRYALASKTLPTEVKSVLDEVIAMVYAIKASTLSTRLFRLLCQVFDKWQENLLYHTEVHWLSKGNMLERVVSLMEEMTKLFSQDSNTKSKEFSRKLLDNEWLLKLAYLNVVIGGQNIPNRSLQGPSTTIIDFVNKLKALIMKLEL